MLLAFINLIEIKYYFLDNRSITIIILIYIALSPLLEGNLTIKFTKISFYTILSTRSSYSKP